MEENPPASRFEDLRVWQKSHELVKKIYRISATFPKHELYGLTGQLRRAAVSVPSNIAEGFKRRTKPDKVRFFNIAQGSLEEARYLMILARDLGYTEDDLAADFNDVGRMLASYANSIVPLQNQRSWQ